MITITHNTQHGTRVHGTVKGDGTAQILLPKRFRWRRSAEVWTLPGTAGAPAPALRIEHAAQALRESGFAVAVQA